MRPHFKKSALIHTFASSSSKLDIHAEEVRKSMNQTEGGAPAGLPPRGNYLE